MVIIADFDSTLILWLNLAATFVFGVSGGLAALRARLDVFGVVVLAGVVGLAGGITRDVLIGVPPETFRDARYLAAAGAAGVAACSLPVFSSVADARYWSSTRLASRCSASRVRARP